MQMFVREGTTSERKACVGRLMLDSACCGLFTWATDARCSQAET